MNAETMDSKIPSVKSTASRPVEALGSTVAGSQRSEFRSNWLITVFFLCVLLSGYLTLLVIRRETLPFDTLTGMSVVAVGYALLCILLLKVFLRIPIFSYPIIFAGASFVYTLSGFILFPMDGWYAFSDFAFVDGTGIEQGLPIVMLAFSSFLLGALLTTMKPQRRTERKRTPDDKISVLRGIGYVTFFLCIFLIAYATSQGLGINLSYVGGYSEFATYASQNLLPYTMSVTYSWFLPWSCLILIGTSGSKKQTWIPLTLALAGITIYLLTGDRTIPAVLLVLIIPARYLMKRPLKFRHIAISILAVLVIVSSWDAIRTVPVVDWTRDSLTSTIASETFGITTNQGIRNTPSDFRTPFGWILANVSNSYQTLMGAVRLVPNVEPFRYGRDYLRSILLVIPFILTRSSIDLGEQPTQWITQLLVPGSRSGLGFLQVGEAYINFGAIGVLCLYFFLGWLLSILWAKLDGETTDQQFLTYSMILMSAFLIWIRNDSSSVIRTAIWGWLIVYGIPFVIVKFRRSS